ncbi:MAG: hypothetical protein RSG55_08115 [Oscillospiraceae bacterium]
MTIADIEKIDKNMLVATDIAPYLECNDGLIRLQAQNEPEKLGFPVIVMGTRVKIPKDGFIHYCRYGRMVYKADETGG